MSPEVSVVIPARDEEESVGELHGWLCGALEAARYAFEVVYVDDGSKDATFARLQALAAKDERVTVLRLRENAGKAGALSTGIARARGAVVVLMDADLQDDPTAIPSLVDRIHEGYDAVSGWRRQRHDRLLDRRLPSVIANRLIAAVTRVPIHDHGCGLKAFRREVVVRVLPRLRGGMHRFIMVLCAQAGGRVCELVVPHHPRRFGRSKYGLGRVPHVVVDLVRVTLGSGSATRSAHDAPPSRGGGSEHTPLMQVTPWGAPQQSAVCLHLSPTFEQPPVGGPQTGAPPPSGVSQ
jgi:glycosyltransferase involved in cell wall biosynthesis